MAPKKDIAGRTPSQSATAVRACPTGCCRALNGMVGRNAGCKGRQYSGLFLSQKRVASQLKDAKPFFDLKCCLVCRVAGRGIRVFIRVSPSAPRLPQVPQTDFHPSQMVPSELVLEGRETFLFPASFKVFLQPHKLVVPEKVAPAC